MVNQNYDLWLDTINEIENCNGDMSVLMKYVSSEDAGLRTAVAKHCNGNVEILDILKNDKDENVREAVAIMCKNRPDILIEYANDDSEFVRYNAVKE